MADTSSPLRVSRLIWWTRLIQLLFVLIVLGVTGSWSTQFAGIGCSAPVPIAFNVACASLSFLVLLFVIPTTGPLSKTQLWNRWVQLIVDFIFLILWIAAAAVSTETCSDLCTACHWPKFEESGYVLWQGALCICPWGAPAYQVIENDLFKRQSPVSPLVKRWSVSTGTRSEAGAAGKTLAEASEMAVKHGLDAAIILLFALTFIYGLFMAFRKPNSATGHVEMTAGENEAASKMGATATESEVPGP